MMSDGKSFLAHAATRPLLAAVAMSLALAAVSPGRLNAQTEPRVSEALGMKWLSDLQSPTVRTWVADHNRKTRDFVSLDNSGQPDAMYAALQARAKELIPSNPPSSVMSSAGRLVQKAGGLVIVDSAGVETVLAPKIVEPDGSGTLAVAEFKVSPDLAKVAVSYVKNGSDLNNWYVYDLATKSQIAGPMVVRLAGLGWAADSSGVYYTQWANPAELAKDIRYTQNIFHDLKSGTEELVFKPFQTKSREIYIVEDVTIDGERVMFAYRNQVVAEIPFGVYMGRVRQADPARGEFQVGKYAWTPVKVGATNVLGKVVSIDGPKLILRNSELGDGFGLQQVDVSQLLRGGKIKTKTIVKEQKGEVLIVAQAAGDKLLLQYFNKKNFEWTIKVASKTGKIQKSFRLSDVGLPNVGQLSTFVVSAASNEAFVVYNDFRVPNVTLKIDLSKNSIEALKSASVPSFDANRVKYEMSWVKSFDGTMIPVSVYSRTDQVKPKFAYVFYYGYIGIAHFGWWSRKIQMVLDMGGTVMMVHHRGGGEQGLAWQMSVKVDRLPSYEDTVAATRWLKAKTGVDKVVASGRSFGGLHTLGLMVHHANEFDLFAPVVSVSEINEFLDVGLFGYFAVDDFGIERSADGTPLDTPAWRKRLAAWSPLANLDKMAALKPTIIFTADSDERTGPEQSYYVAEALNKKYPGNNLVYLYEEKHNGHSGRTELIDELAFIGKQFGISKLEPLK